MKSGLRLAVCIIVLLTFSLYLLEAHLRDLCNQYRAGAYLVDWLDQTEPVSAPSSDGSTPGDKVIVMAKMQGDPTGWVQEQLPEYVTSAVLSFHF